jgi:hypothetical protein
MGDFTRQQLWDRWMKSKAKVKELQDVIHKFNHFDTTKERLINMEVRKLQTIHKNELKKKDEKIDELRAKLKTHQLRSKVSRFRTREKVRERSELKKKFDDFKEEVKYLSKDFEWDNTTSRLQHLEIIVRTIITYNKLTNNNIITFHEFAVLLLGSQKQYFNKKDIIDRYTNLGRFLRSDLKLFLEIGYIRKVERKPYWYITVMGKKRLNEILKFIYEEKVGLFKFDGNKNIKSPIDEVD